VENATPEHPPEIHKDLHEFEQEGLIEYVDLTEMYFQKVKENFDLNTIRDSGIGVAYDAMYGAGQDIMKKILPDAYFLNCDFNPSFKGQAPEPIHRNLSELSQALASDPNLHVGIANDGDADRVGMYDENGEFVDSHHLLLLLLYYLREFKGFEGKVAVSFSVTDKMKNLAEHYGVDFIVTKIGFKYIAEIMRSEQLIVGGEESGGLTVAGHIPERDGIWTALLVLELMSKTGKKLTELISTIDAMVGAFAFDRDDLHLPEEKKQAIIDKCARGAIKQIGPYVVEEIQDIDGYKFFLGDGRWVMLRPSGTEPLLRVYAQAGNMLEVRKILDITRENLIT
jgi:phosphomannomutase